MTFRQFVLVTHRWVGLLSSVVLLVAGLTGAWLMLPMRPRRLAALHSHLFLGAPGVWLVNVATALSALLVIGGVILWWRSKLMRVTVTRGWRRILHDLHYVVGTLAALVMLVLALTGSALMAYRVSTPPPAAGGEAPREPDRNDPRQRTRRLVHSLHTGRPYNMPIKVIYFLGSMAFVLQGVSGFMMWWKPSLKQP